MYDVIIAGGGPAGLSAGLLLGRCRRRVLICDVGSPRNRHSRALHAYLTRDGIAPGEFIRLGRREAAAYGVEFRSVEASAVSRLPAGGDGFEVRLGDGGRERARFLLIATGVVDEVPDVEGLRPCYGQSVFHCPYCDGWEWRDRRLGVLAAGAQGAALALSLKTWSPDVCLFANGRGVQRPWRERLVRNQVAVERGTVTVLHHEQGRLQAVEVAGGRRVACDALFFATHQRPQSPLAVSLGCSFNRKGTVATGLQCETNVPGVFVAGDASHDAQYVVVAAAEGFKAALSINQALQRRELLP